MPSILGAAVVCAGGVHSYAMFLAQKRAANVNVFGWWVLGARLYDSNQVNYETIIVILVVVCASSEHLIVHTSIDSTLDPTGFCFGCFFFSLLLYYYIALLLLLVVRVLFFLFIFDIYTHSVSLSPARTPNAVCYLYGNVNDLSLAAYVCNAILMYAITTLNNRSVERLSQFANVGESHTEDYTHLTLTNTCVRAIAVHRNTERQKKDEEKKNPYSHVVFCCHRQFPAPATEWTLSSTSVSTSWTFEKYERCIAAALYMIGLYVLAAAFVVDGSGCDRR